MVMLRSARSRGGRRGRLGLVNLGLALTLLVPPGGGGGDVVAAIARRLAPVAGAAVGGAVARALTSHGPRAARGVVRTAEAAPTSTSLWSWGLNASPQPGQFAPGDPTVSGPAAVAAGANHSLEVRADGSVVAWGSNTSGQLGNGTTGDSLATPVQVTGLANATLAAGGALHSLAVRDDGTVWAWGNNGNGRLGDGTTSQRLTPVQVKGSGGVGFLSGVAAVAAGTSHSVALKEDGS